MRLLYHVTIRANIENSCRDLRIAKKTHLDKKKLYEKRNSLLLETFKFQAKDT